MTYSIVVISRFGTVGQRFQRPQGVRSDDERKHDGAIQHPVMAENATRRSFLDE